MNQQGLSPPLPPPSILRESLRNLHHPIYRLRCIMFIYWVSQKTWEFSDEFDTSLLRISIAIPNFKSHNIIMSARVYFMKTVNGCKDVFNVSARWTVKTDKFTLFVYCNFHVLLSTTVYSQNINKQNVNIADETLTDYSFLSRYHYT